MVIYYLQFFQYFVHSGGGLTLRLIFMCVLMFAYFLLTRSEGHPLVDVERITCACSWCWYGKSKA
jgi:hypothetical protein